MGEREQEGSRKPAEPTMAAPASTPATASTPMPSAGGTPAAYAQMLRTNPSARNQILTELHQTRGNAFVQSVLAESDQGAARRTVPSASQGGGSALPTDVRARMESTFGADLSAVRIHEDSAAEGAGAEAYTQGTDIHFAPGLFDPSSSRGLELLGHEVAHVVQQAEGRVEATVQHKRAGAMNDDAGLEHEADQAGATAARGGVANTGAKLGGAAPVVQRKVTVAAIPAAKKAKLDVLGDGTAANKGLAIEDLQAYTAKQADWFTDPSFSAADRESVWKVVNLFQYGMHVAPALGKLHTGEVAALPLPNQITLKKYFDCFDSSVDTIQLTTPAPDLAHALAIGVVMTDLATFVPGAVLRHVIPASGLDFLIKKTKVAELKTYYMTFRPTLEKPQEWDHIEVLLTETVGRWMGLLGWINELHIYTPNARATLLKNVGNKGKTKPVMLVVMSGLDWNTAFLQATQLEANLADGKNLALVIQGRTIAALTAKVASVAKDYGQGGKLGQVVLAGHGSDTSMEMASDSTTAEWDGYNDRVKYDGQNDINSKTVKSKDPSLAMDPKANGTEALIDTILASMDPATANLVFAGCLINSHDIDPSKSKLTGKPADVEKALRANIAAHPNLAEYVKSRMVATGHNATMSAANASTFFDSYKLDGSGKAILDQTVDPDIGGTKLAYLRTGIEPEGVLRAAIECCSDPALGIVKTTAEIRTRNGLPGKVGSHPFWDPCIRAALQIATPGAANVNVSVLADLVGRIGEWGEFGRNVPCQRLADKVTKDEAKIVFPAMLATAPGPDIAAGIHQAWMKHDGTHEVQMMTELTASSFTSEDFVKQLSRGLVSGHLSTMLKVGAPTRGQMILALTIADQDGAKMPATVKDFLRAAAGGAASRAFPVARDVDTILPNGAPRILQAIGLSATSAAPTTGSVDGNVDLDGDSKNETLVSVAPQQMEVATKTDPLMVLSKAATGKRIGAIPKGATVRVAGSTHDGAWSMIDFNGQVGFVFTHYLKSV